MIKFYNTLTRKLEEFRPIKEGEAGVYSCGPTVYWNQHIGHMYAYVHWDTLVRFLRWSGFKVTWVMNVTDVGHLTSDADTGEDKMEKGAKREGISVWEVADKYIAQFKDSLNLLNIQPPDVLCRATDHIKEQIQLVQLIEARGFTYQTKKGLVFDTSKFPDYARFAQLNLTQQKTARVNEVKDDPEKKQPWDFFLWVFDPHHQMAWESPWGKGYPGWHLECTAMSTTYLGNKFDIHTGGIEHVGVHHTNEIAQAYGAFGHQTANYWLHNAWLTGKGGEKMSKSLGNFVTAQELVAQGYSPLSLRYLIFNSQYRKGLDFSWEALDNAARSWQNLRRLVQSFKTSRDALSSEKNTQIDNYRERLKTALASDLNLPQALAVVWEIAKSNLPGRDKYDLLLDFEAVLGLELDQGESEAVSEEVQKLAAQREKARLAKNWSLADRLRGEIQRLGWQVKDEISGPTKITKL
ncbi:MAG: cysteine--tRNA ligase [Candidatus Shapirobacteria bacterium]